MFKKRIYFAFCVVPTFIGMVIGWQVGENIGIAALPPNAWAGDGAGIFDCSITGSGWGALIGIGVACCVAWYFVARRRQSRKVSLQTSAPEDEVWPPAPTHLP